MVNSKVTDMIVNFYDVHIFVSVYTVSYTHLDVYKRQEPMT